MMITRHILSFFTLWFCIGLSPAIGQETAEQLESKRKQLEAEIEYTNKLIKETRKNKQVTLNELKLINNRVNQRNELIATLKKEINYLNTQIDVNNLTVRKLNKELEELKQEYARIVYFAYKHQTAYNKLIYLFSSEDLNQAYQRLRYIDQVSAFIRTESANIKERESDKVVELNKLNNQMAEKSRLLDKENVQILKLEQEKIQKDRLKQELQGKEKQLTAALKKKEKESNKLKKKIEDIIARETKPKVTKSGKKEYALSPEEIILSASFASNKGSLPWPILRGMISETFGVHQHPVLRNVKTKNNGVDIATSPGEKARSVFDGKVVSVTKITASNIAVIIKHGDYFTVYSNLDEVFVSQGDMVSTKEDLGNVHTSLKGITELHFEVWKGKTLQNPAFWILPNK